MATPDAATAAADVVNSLDLDDVPNKLKCAICSKLALSSFKLPCCAQSICESCQSTLNGSCPVCEHSPLSPDLCVPHKALRNTIKAYLKTAEKKLSEERAKSQKNPPASESTASAASGMKQEGSPAAEDESGRSTRIPRTENIPVEIATTVDEPQSSIKADEYVAQSTANQQNFENAASGLLGESSIRPSEDVAEISDIVPSGIDSVGPDSGNGFGDAQNNAMNFGMGNNGIPSMMNMGMGHGNNMDYNQMMQFMSNGMMNSPGMNSMMGMPGIGMNSVSQGMFGGFNQGMGMNQMNGMNGMSGMNMGFDPSGGQGMYAAGWNGSNNMWSTQTNGMESGFVPNAGFGYNMSQQGNFNQNQYPYNDFQHGYRGQGYNRGRGRGRGSFGWRGQGIHGSHMQGDHSNYQQQSYPHQGQQQQAQAQAQLNQVEGTSNWAQEQAKTLDDFAPGGQEETNEALGISPTKENTTVAEEKAQDAGQADNAPAPGDAIIDDSRCLQDENQEQDHGDRHGEKAPATVNESRSVPVDEAAGNPIEVHYNEHSVDVAQPPLASPTTNTMPPPGAPLGPSGHNSYSSSNFAFRGRGYGRFVTRGRGGFASANGHGIPLHDSRNQFQAHGQGVPGAPTGPKGAPTGPKALRQENPVKILSPTNGGRRPSGNADLHIIGRASISSKEEASKISEGDSKKEYEDDGHSDYRERGLSHSLSRSRSTSPHRSRRDCEQQSSRDVSDEDHESSSRRRKDRRRGSKYDEESFPVNGEDACPSDEESHRDSGKHRHHRGVEKDRDRDRDRQSKHKRSSHRSRRHHDDKQYDDHSAQESGTLAYDSRSKPSREPSNFETESRSSSHRDHRDRHRSSRDHEGSHHREERRRDRDRDGKRDREKERERERDRPRDKDRDREKERDRKRSRRDHDSEEEEVDKNSTHDDRHHHRSRRQKHDHNYDYADNPIQGAQKQPRSSPSRQDRIVMSAAKPVVAIPAPQTASATTEAEKDPYTVEREARHRERLLKEQQRREAMNEGSRSNRPGIRKGSGSVRQYGGTGRRVSYKYEDDGDYALRGGEKEREAARWR